MIIKAKQVEVTSDPEVIRVKVGVPVEVSERREQSAESEGDLMHLIVEQLFFSWWCGGYDDDDVLVVVVNIVWQNVNIVDLRMLTILRILRILRMST